MTATTEGILQDVRFALRQWRHAPSFTLTAALTISLGIGATTTIFSAANALLIRTPAGIRDAGSLVSVSPFDEVQGQETRFSYALFDAYRRSETGLSDVAVLDMFPASLSLGSEAEPEVVSGMAVSAGYFGILGTRPHLGRFFLPEEDAAPGVSPVVVLSYRYWTRRLGADSTVLGRTVDLNRRAFEVIGVAEEGFQGNVPGYDFAVWTPMSMAGSISTVDIESWGYHGLSAIGRLAPGRSIEQAAAAAHLITNRLRTEHARDLENTMLLVQPFSKLFEEIRGPVTTLIALLFGLAIVVLLIASMNVGGLLLSRASIRSREIGVRLALGAGRRRLVRQFLTESVLLFALGSVVATFLTSGATRALSSLTIPSPVPVVLDLTPDLRVLGFTVVAALVTGIAFGLAPAVHATRADVVSTIKGGSPSSGPQRVRIRSAFVAVQVAGSVVLLATAGVLSKAVDTAGDVDIGFDPAQLHVMRVDLSLHQYKPEEATAFFAEFRARAAALPEVESVSAATSIPMGYVSSST
jgi:putative ABC transport system permease protein